MNSFTGVRVTLRAPSRPFLSQPGRTHRPIHQRGAKLPVSAMLNKIGHKGQGSKDEEAIVIPLNYAKVSFQEQRLPLSADDRLHLVAKFSTQSWIFMPNALSIPPI